MRARVVLSNYEHPVHSGILDLSDPIWVKHFTKEELKEMSSFNTTPLATISADLEEYFNKYESLPSTSTSIRKFVFSHYNDPSVEFDKKWVQESFLAANNLFNYRNNLDVSNFSEADSLQRVWCFVPPLFDDEEIDAKLGEKYSVAVAISKDSNRVLELDERRTRKTMGAKLDILFKCGLIEVGSCEIGKAGVIEVDDKYLDDGMVKLSKTLRDMLAALVKKNPGQINDLKTVGFLMMGLSMEILIMNVSVGSSVTRIRRSSKFEFPESVDCLALDLISLLEITWKGKELMKETLRVVNDRKENQQSCLIKRTMMFLV